MKDHITRQQFLLEFFGLLGRNFGDPDQWFTDNPMDIFKHIDKCAVEKKPCFISVQPMSKYQKVAGIEKIFYDFDYGRKSDKMTSKQIERHRAKMEIEIGIFLCHLTKEGIVPLVVKTRKGYHIYIYFDRIYEVDINNDEDEKFWRKVYGFIHKRFVKGNRHEYIYVDTTSKKDIKRLCRVPTSIHQKSGEECIILDAKLRPTKFRSIEYYKMYGLKREDLIGAVEWVRTNEEKEKKETLKREQERKKNWQSKHGYTGEIRICFQVRMEKGEMCHQQRLALAIEAFYSGMKTRQGMVDFFRWANDWDGDDPNGDCWVQVNWFFDKNVKETRKGEPICKVKPYRCSTIETLGWCLKSDCPIWRYRQEKLKRKKKLK